MSSLNALDVLDDMIAQTCSDANAAAGVISTFDAIGAGTGVGIRLRALQDARAAVVVDALRRLEDKP